MTKINKVTVAHVGDFLAYPPVISLIDNFLTNGIKVELVSSSHIKNLPERFLKSNEFNYTYVKFSTQVGLQAKLKRLLVDKKSFQKTVESKMSESDILWTTTDVTVKILGDLVLKYKHVMQLMELIQSYPHFLGLKMLEFPISKYAQSAYKVVVPDLDRAYIQQAWWNLEQVPVVLPNKPYRIESGTLATETQRALEIIKKERRKILFYSGIITPERNIGDFAAAIADREDYCLYIVGSYLSHKEYFEQLLTDYPNIVYLGYHTAPSHLEFVKYAYIGLTPYIPTKSNFYPEINALYCAPNKIYEYSAFGVPMVGTNVLGLLRPFEQHGIGRCAVSMSASDILEAITSIEKDYTRMSDNCYSFFAKDNLNQIVQDILGG